MALRNFRGTITGYVWVCEDPHVPDYDRPNSREYQAMVFTDATVNGMNDGEDKAMITAAIDTRNMYITINHYCTEDSKPKDNQMIDIKAKLFAVPHPNPYNLSVTADIMHFTIMQPGLDFDDEEQSVLVSEESPAFVTVLGECIETKEKIPGWPSGYRNFTLKTASWDTNAKCQIDYTITFVLDTSGRWTKIKLPKKKSMVHAQEILAGKDISNNRMAIWCKDMAYSSIQSGSNSATAPAGSQVYGEDNPPKTPSKFRAAAQPSPRKKQVKPNQKMPELVGEDGDEENKTKVKKTYKRTGKGKKVLKDDDGDEEQPVVKVVKRGFEEIDDDDEDDDELNEQQQVTPGATSQEMAESSEKPSGKRGPKTPAKPKTSITTRRQAASKAAAAAKQQAKKQKMEEAEEEETVIDGEEEVKLDEMELAGEEN